MARAGSCGGNPLALRRRKAEYEEDGNRTFLDDNAARRKSALKNRELPIGQYLQNASPGELTHSSLRRSSLREIGEAAGSVLLKGNASMCLSMISDSFHSSKADIFGSR